MAGCNNITCGTRQHKDDKDDKGVTQSFTRFIFVRENGKLSFIKQIKKLTRNSTKITQTSGNSFAGCGFKFHWETEAIRLTDEEIFELFSVKTIDEVKELTKNKNFLQSRTEYVNSIDKTIYE